MLKKLGFALVGLIATAGLALAGGQFQNFPLVGGNGATNCTSFGNNGVCNQFQPAGPSLLTGNETIPADTNVQGGGGNTNANNVVFPVTLFGNAYGNATVLTTTGTTASVTVADGISQQIYAGAGTATYTAFNLPANPINNQEVCLINSGSGVLTLSAVAASANKFGNTPTITGVTPTSVPVMTAVGTAGTVTLGANCWLYIAGANNNGVWYRVQ